MPPAALNLPEHPLCLATHPKLPLIITGHHEAITLYTTPESTHLISLFSKTSVSTRDLALLGSVSNPQLFAACSDGLLRAFDINTRKSSVGNEKHAKPIKEGLSAVTCLGSAGFVVAVGDDDGGVRLTDTRVGLQLPSLVVVNQGGKKSKNDENSKRHREDEIGTTSKQPLPCVLEQADYISSLLHIGGTDYLFAASGDGTVCLYDVRVPQVGLSLTSVSDAVDDDLLCLEAINYSTRLVCGTMMGSLEVFTVDSFTASYNEVLLEDHVVRFAGHPGLVSSVLEIEGSEGYIVTGSDDGYLRVVDLGARQSDHRKFRGIVEKFESDVEAMGWVGGRTRGLLAVACLDEKVHFVDLEKDNGGSEEKELEEGHAVETVEQDESEDADDDVGARRRRRKKRRRMGTFEGSSKKEEKNNFFSDL